MRGKDKEVDKIMEARTEEITNPAFGRRDSNRRYEGKDRSLTSNTGGSGKVNMHLLAWKSME